MSLLFLVASATVTCPNGITEPSFSQSTLIPDLFQCLRNPDGSVHITSFNDIGTLIGNVISAGLELAGIIAVAIIIAGGLIYITSNGNPAGIKRGKDTVVNALLGLGIILVAFGAVKFITGQF